MPDPTQIEVPAEAVIASLKAQLSDKCGELAVSQALVQKLSADLDAAYAALEPKEKPGLKIAGEDKP